MVLKKMQNCMSANGIFRLCIYQELEKNVTNTVKYRVLWCPCNQGVHASNTSYICFSLLWCRIKLLMENLFYAMC